MLPWGKQMFALSDFPSGSLAALLNSGLSPCGCVGFVPASFAYKALSLSNEELKNTKYPWSDQCHQAQSGMGAVYRS